MPKITFDQLKQKKTKLDAQRALYDSLTLYESIKPENQAISKKLNRLLREYKKLKGSCFYGNN